MLKAALCGSYVNFGVFRLYGDEALDNALNTFVKLLLSIPQSDLLVNIHISHNTNILFISQIICFLIIKFISAALMNYCTMKQLKYLLYCIFIHCFSDSIIQNCRQHIICCSNVWRKITWSFYPLWNPGFSSTFSPVSAKALQHQVRKKTSTQVCAADSILLLLSISSMPYLEIEINFNIQTSIYELKKNLLFFPVD